MKDQNNKKSFANTRKKAKIWLRIAVSDLKTAKLLYSNGHFRTSYFFFQQAVEKANKAAFIQFFDLKECDLIKMRHDQFKFYIEKFIERKTEIESTINTISILPSKIR